MAIYDFSEWQGNIDFGQLRGNAELVVLRVQAGSTHPDKDYAQYASGAKANGIPFGTYAYGKFISVSDAQQEAKDCYARTSKDSIFIVIDVEEVDCPENQLIPATQAYVDYLHSQGVKKVGLYSGEYFYKSHGLSAVNCDFLWLANYGANDGQMHNKPSIACDLWQYSSVASASGVVGHVDIDVLNGGKPLSYFTGVENSVAGTTKQTIFLPASNDTWTVYKLGHEPNKSNSANIAGELAPKQFNGLTYDIKATTSYPDVYIIHTDAFGDVQIYGAPSTGAVINTITVTPPPQPAPAPAPLGLVGCIDSPTQGKSVEYGTTTIKGWFLNGNGVGTIQILIDSDTQTYAWGTYGDSRDDVLKAYPQYNNAKSGYHCDIDTAKLGLGDHTLTVIGYSSDNKSSLKLPPITFKVESISLPIGSMATIKTTASNYVGGAVIPTELRGKQYKVTGMTNITKYSYSTKQYTLEGIPSPVYEQDIVETGVFNGAVYPPPAPTPTPTPAPVVPIPVTKPTPVVAPVVEPTPAPVASAPVEVPSAPTPKPVEVPVVTPSAPTTAPVASLAQQIEDAVLKDPQLQKNFIQKILNFFVSLFK